MFGSVSPPPTRILKTIVKTFFVRLLCWARPADRLQSELFAMTYVVRRGVFYSFDSVDVSVCQMKYGVRHLVSRRLYVCRI